MTISTIYYIGLDGLGSLDLKSTGQVCLLAYDHSHIRNYTGIDIRLTQQDPSTSIEWPCQRPWIHS